jgi:hypothetical protein
VGAVPAPPGPGVGEIPPRALDSEPTLVPVLPAPEPAPVMPLPEASLRPMLEPPPEPPRPGLSPPEGDMASEPLPLPGTATVEPGWDEITTPDALAVPLSPLGGARTDPASPGPPRPEPFLPRPLSPGPEPTEGGGGTIFVFVASRAPWLEAESATDGGGGITPDAPTEEFSALLEADPATEGGGGTTLAASDPPGGAVEVRDIPEVLPEETLGGGGTILLASAPADSPPGLRLVPGAVPAETLGGGGTTSCVPKSLPIMLLTNEPPLVCVGGGGTTVLVGSAAPPLSSRRKSCAESEEGGGAMTEGAGRLSFALRIASRSGAETGGGTTATLFICARVGETSRLTAEGAGGITLVLRAGDERA